MLKLLTTLLAFQVLASNSPSSRGMQSSASSSRLHSAIATQLGSDAGLLAIYDVEDISPATQAVLAHLNFQRVVGFNGWDSFEFWLPQRCRWGWKSNETRTVFVAADKKCRHKAGTFSPTTLNSRQLSAMALAKVMPRKRRWAAGDIVPRAAGC